MTERKKEEEKGEKKRRERGMVSWSISRLSIQGDKNFVETEEINEKKCRNIQK